MQKQQQNNIRSLILFPFNLWFWVITIPFRVFLYVVFGDFWRWSAKSNTLRVDQKLDETKQLPQTGRKQTPVPKKQAARYPSFIAPVEKPETPLKSKATQRKTETKQKLKERFPGFISADVDVPAEAKKETKEERVPSLYTEGRSNIEYEFYETTPKLEKEERKERSREIENIKVNTTEIPSEDIQNVQLSALQGRINELEQHERELIDTNARLEEELTSISKLRDTENARFKEIRLALDVNQRKCFDYSQEIIALKNQVIEQARLYTELDSKYQSIHDKQKQKKKTQRKKKSKSELSPQAETIPSQAQGKQAEVEAPQNVWGQHDHTKDFTKMVSEAQHEEIIHSKPFSEVVKESVQREAPKKAPEAEEFIVIGGNMSSAHIVEKRKPEPKEVTPAPQHEAQVGNTVWGIPDHKKDFTKMVAEAQKEEFEHVKTFSEVLKEKAVVEDDEDSLAPAKEEFLVLGGSSSSRHVIETPISSK